MKSIEIFYDVDAIEGVAPSDSTGALNFRNAAMELIENALEAKGAGEWAGAEYGSNFKTGQLEVNFGFEVEDFDVAEAIVREVVKGTRFENIREIERVELDEADFL